MHLTTVSFDSQLMKGDILQRLNCNVASPKSNHILVEQSFHSEPLGDEDLKCHTLQSEDFNYWKRNL